VLGRAVTSLPAPRRQQDYQHWYPEEVTFQPKLNESAMSREFLRKSLQKEGSSLGPNASGAERHMALVNRLYASYEKVWGCRGFGGQQTQWRMRGFVVVALRACSCRAMHAVWASASRVWSACAARVRFLAPAASEQAV
jgi:hypothetical protein